MFADRAFINDSIVLDAGFGVNPFQARHAADLSLKVYYE